MTETGFEVASAYVTLLIEDADFEAAVTEKIEAACAVGAANGGDVMTSGLASAAAKSGDEIEAALLEAVGGSGDAMAVQIGEGLTGGLGTAGGQAGEQFAAEFESMASDVGDLVSQEIAQPLTSGLSEAGAAAGEAFAAELTASTETVGEVLGGRISEQLRLGLDEAAQASMSVLGEINASGFASTLASSAAGSGFLSSLTADLSDAAAEAGGAAGVELSRNLSEAAVAALSDEEFAQFTDMLVATASTAGTEAGAAAAESLGVSLSNSLVGVDLLAEGMSTAGRSMRAGAQAAAEAAAQEITEVEESTLTGVQAYEAELDAIFESIYRGGNGMTVQLAAAMVEAFQGIEADTTGFTRSELSIFTEFYEMLDQLGDRAALDFAERMRLVQQEVASSGDLMASGMSTIGLPMPGGGVGSAEPAGPQVAVPGLAVAGAEARTAAAATEEVGTAARDATGALGGMAGMMGGQWLWGILGAVTMLPMFSGMLSNSSAVAQAAAQAQQQLAQSVSQDSNMVGANTVATIANQLATSGAADTLQGYGISLSQATAAMAGAKSAQVDVNGTLLNQVDNLQAVISAQEASGSATAGQIQIEKQQLAQYQATHDAMVQMEQDVVNAVQHQNELTQATINAEQAADVFDVQVRAGVLALQQQAQTANVNAAALSAYTMTLVPSSKAYTSAVDDQTIALANNSLQAQINARALNNSLSPQAQLSTEAVDAAAAYQQASTATGGDTNALTALYGQYGQTSGSQAAFTTALAGLNGTITDGTNAVDLNTAAGAKNFTAFQNAATAAETYAEKVYQQTGSSQAADTALQTMIGKLDDAAHHAGLTKDQIHQLNMELVGVQNVSDIHIKLDDSQALSQAAAFSAQIQGEIASINNESVTPGAGGAGGHALSGARASGGPVQAGQAYLVGEQRPEVYVPQSDGWIFPSVDEGAHALAGGGVTVHQHFYGTQWPSFEQSTAMNRELAIAVGAI